jgi:gas vesicle protein
MMMLMLLLLKLMKKKRSKGVLMMSQPNNSLEKFLMGTLIGGLLGALLGILLAPRSGEETRKLLQDEAKNRYDTGKDAITTGYTRTVDTVKEGVDTSIAQISDATSKLKAKAELISSQLAETARKTGETFKSTACETGLINGDAPATEAAPEPQHA